MTKGANFFHRSGAGARSMPSTAFPRPQLQSGSPLMETATDRGGRRFCTVYSHFGWCVQVRQRSASAGRSCFHPRTSSVPRRTLPIPPRRRISNHGISLGIRTSVRVSTKASQTMVCEARSYRMLGTKRIVSVSCAIASRNPNRREGFP